MKTKKRRYRCAEPTCPRMVVTDRTQNPPAYCKICRKARSQFSLAR